MGFSTGGNGLMSMQVFTEVRSILKYVLCLM